MPSPALLVKYSNLVQLGDIWNLANYTILISAWLKPITSSSVISRNKKLILQIGNDVDPHYYYYYYFKDEVASLGAAHSVTPLAFHALDASLSWILVIPCITVLMLQHLASFSVLFLALNYVY